MKAAVALISAIAVVALSAIPAGSAPSWTVVNDAGTPPATELTSIACVTTTHCFTVGYRQTATDYVPVIEQGFGKSWSRMSRPVPAARQASTTAPLSSVECPGPKNCFAVGNYINSAGRATALIYHWNGSAWGIMKAAPPVIVKLPHPKVSQRTSLSDITCPTAKLCLAVGYYEGVNGSINPLVERWTGSTWTAQTAPLTKTIATVLNGVSCWSTTNCFAVGGATSAAHTRPYLLRWDGATWAIAPQPGLANASLDDISCASASVCFSVGTVVAPTTNTLLERWNGTKWSVIPLKNMPTANHLYDIDCPSTTMCLAVGRRGWMSNAYRPLALRWNGNGTTWTAVNPPNQPDADSNWLNSVACRSATVCRAVGTYRIADTYHSFIENYG